MRILASKISTGCLILAIGFLVSVVPTRAARDLSAVPKPGNGYELLVLEVSPCMYCQLFRRDVVPTYNATTHAKSVPMRFVDLNHGKLDAFKLAGPVDTVPTVILLHRQREVGRLAGHVGPEIFLHAVDRMLSEAP